MSITLPKKSSQRYCELFKKGVSMEKYNQKLISKDEARKRVKPTSDLFVRWLFGNETHTEITKAFINAVLKDSGKPLIKGVSIMSPFVLAECLNGKTPITDVEVSDENGSLYNIEIQTYNDSSFFLRLKYYWAGVFHRQLKKSHAYGELKPCTVIALATNRLFIDSKKPHHFSITVDSENKTQPFFTPADPESYHILELSEFENTKEWQYTISSMGEQRKLDEQLFSWLRFFKYGSLEEYMDKYEETETAVKEAKELYENFIDDDRLMFEQLRRDRQGHDLAQFEFTAREAGLAEGKEIGLAEGHTDTARNMKNMGLSLDII